jgi:peptide/nickel transport system ATP-binding protein
VSILTANDLRVHFPTRRGTVHAVDGVSFAVDERKTLGLVGESGCGKSTLGKAVVRLYKPTSGQILLDDDDIAPLSGARLRRVRPHIQMVFQDPNASLNPRKRVVDIIDAPLAVNGRGTKAERLDTIRRLLDRVGLGDEALHRFPHEFSGGQRQRIAIARALALHPRLIVCDEPVSALDVSIRAQVLNLLTDLQNEFGLSYLFISHDLAVVELVSDRVAVMYLGKIVEYADGNSLWEQQFHPYTKALMSAVPVPDPDAGRMNKRILLTGELPSPINPPSGCRFRTRCPFARPRCSEEEPDLRVLKRGHFVACHFAEELAA